jgi:glycosyltransferase involved in cell wall biosynthesis
MSFETAATLSSNQDKAILERLGNRVQFHPVRMDRWRWLRGWIRKLWWGTVEAMKAQKRHHYQILHARSFFPSLTAWLVTLRFGGKWIYDTRNFFWEEQVEMGRSRRNLLVQWGFWMDRWLVRKADTVIAITETAARSYERQRKQGQGVAKPAIIIHNNYDPERFRLDLAQREKRRDELHIAHRTVLLYSGSLVAWNRFPDMARFCNRFQSKYGSGYTLWCSYEWTMESREMATGLLTGDYQLLTLSSQEVGDTLQSADAALMFLTLTTSRTTTIPIKFAEYLACGLPVVLNAGIHDPETIVRKYRVGIVLPDMSDTAIDRAVDELVVLLADPEVKQRAQEAAHTEFHLDQAIEKYRQCYQDLLS